MIDREMYLMIEKLRNNLEYIRDEIKEPLSKADADMVGHAWHWARPEYVPGGAEANPRSVKFYHDEIQRIALMVRGPITSPASLGMTRIENQPG